MRTNANGSNKEKVEIQREKFKPVSHKWTEHIRASVKSITAPNKFCTNFIVLSVNSALIEMLLFVTRC